VNQIPPTTVPVDIEDDGITWRVRSHYNTWFTPIETPPPQEVHDKINQMDEWEKQLLKGMEVLVPPGILLQQRHRQLFLASDGSVQEHTASYGWILATAGGIRLIRCNGPAYGYRPTSFRAEGYGLLSAL
jgi:hypothetical protein